MQTIWLVGYWSYQLGDDPDDDHPLYWLNRRLATYESPCDAQAFANGWKACMAELDAAGYINAHELDSDEYLAVKEVPVDDWVQWWEEEVRLRAKFARKKGD